MKTIYLKEFTDSFMDISSKLTNAEIRMLYLLITEPYVINLSQQKLADKIRTHRRTINIGLKKLLKYKYVSDINITYTQTIEERAKEFVLKEVARLNYAPDKNEKFYISQYEFKNILKYAQDNFKVKREFITKTIKETYPNCVFFWQKK